MLDLPRFATAELPSLTAVFAAGRTLSLELFGQRWALELRFDSADYQCDIRCDLVVDGAPVSIFLDDIAGRALLQRWYPELEVWTLPDAMRAALVEVALEDAIARLEAATGWSVSVRALVAGAAATPVEGRRVDFALRDAAGGTGGLLGHLQLGDDSLQRLATLVGRVAPQPDPARCDAVPLTVHLEIGWCALSVAALRALRPRDLIVLDGHAVGDDGALVLRVAGKLGLHGRLEGSRFILNHLMSDMMAESNEGTATPPAGSVDDLEVRLTFDVGERQITLGELKGVAPGQVFDLGRDIRRAVAIRANGQTIGTGELVQVDSRIAVRVLSLFDAGDGQSS